MSKTTVTYEGRIGLVGGVACLYQKTAADLEACKRHPLDFVLELFDGKKVKIVVIVEEIDE